MRQHAARLVVRVGGDVGHGVNATGRHRSRVQRGQHRAHRQRCRPLANRRVKFIHPEHAPGVVRQRRVSGQVGPADHAHQPLENAVAIARHQRVSAVLAAVSIGGRNAGQGAAARFAHRTKGAVLGQQAFHAVEHRLVQRHVNHLALTRAVAVLQRQQNADHAVQRRQRVAHAHTHPHRHTAGLGRQVAQAAHGLGHHAKTGAVTVRATLAVTAHAQHDQPRVQPLQGVRPQAPALHGAGAKVLYHHIAFGGQPAHDVLRLTLPQVQRQRALVARLHLPPDRGAVLEQAPLAQRITRAGRLDLDDLGPEVRQRLGRKRPGNQLAEFQHLETVQRTGAQGRGGRGKLV